MMLQSGEMYSSLLCVKYVWGRLQYGYAGWVELGRINVGSCNGGQAMGISNGIGNSVQRDGEGESKTTRCREKRREEKWCMG